MQRTLSLLHAARAAGVVATLRGFGLTRLVRIASDLGVSKIRITGGEPLTRRDVLKLFQQLSELRGITDIGLSTNGSLLAKPVDGGQTVASALVKFRVSPTFATRCKFRQFFVPGDPGSRINKGRWCRRCV